LQSADGGWESFHAELIVSMAQELDRCLPSNYYAIAEKSLQISEIGLSTEYTRRSRPDISIYQTGASGTSASMPATATAPVAILALAPVLEDEDDYLTAAVIYEVADGGVPGRPVVRIELLSPANKPPQAYYRQYAARRLQTIRSGLTLVEIDLLHESCPVIRTLPSYPDRDEGAYPYLIIVSSPHPTPEQGQMELHGFGVDTPIPAVSIPLSGSLRVILNLGSVYSGIFASSRFYRMVVDYEKEPLRFAAYTEADRERIRRWMVAIQETHSRS
jgi:hypothetical protein